MTAADFAPIIQAIIACIAAVLTGLVGIYVPKAIAAFESRTGVQLTDQQRSTIMDAAHTEVGIIKLKVDQNVLKLSDIKPDNPVIMAHAQAALSRVPQTAAAMNKTVPSMAETIVGMVGNIHTGG